MAAIPISSAVGAPLSSLLIEYGEGLFGLSGWRAMFLLEGIPAVVLGVVTWFFLTDRPGDAAWLEPAERAGLTTALGGGRRAQEPAPTTCRSGSR